MHEYLKETQLKRLDMLLEEATLSKLILSLSKKGLF